jgi:hypothetical protein
MMPGLRDAARLLRGEVSNGQILCPGPGHSDDDHSLSVKLDPTAPEGFLVNSFAGDDVNACRDYVRTRLGLPEWKPNSQSNKDNGEAKSNGRTKRRLGPPTAVYPYTDENGELLFEVLRYTEPTKSFRQRRPNGGGWIWNTDGIRRVPYRLPEVTEAIAQGRPVVVVEGEKDVDNLAKLGIPATCNRGGATHWTEEDSQFLKDADVVIVPDNDEAGRKHVEVVATSLRGIAKRISVLELPDLSEKGDASDWLKAGHDADEFWALAEVAPEWLPQSDETEEPDDSRPIIWLIKGEQPRAVDETTALLRDSGEIFERGGELVHVVGQKVEGCNDEWLLDFLGRRARFIGFKSVGGTMIEEPRDVPPWLPRRINAKAGERGMQELCAIATAPTLRPDGSVLNTAGYDGATHLLLVAERFADIPDNPTEDQLRKAADDLWYPFRDFPFVDDVSRGVMLAGLLTAPIRQTLPIAPGFSIDAPEAGTGKTSLGACIQALVGMDMAVIPECRDEEEVRKRLLSALRAGQPAILFDNIRGTFGSASLEALLTSQHYSDRVLGVSRMISLPTNTMVLFSGNNFRPAGDLWRRILTARINAETETPELREFDLNPFDFCRNGRQRLIAAAVTLLRGFVCAGSPRATHNRMASFETWDDRVRQAVLWLGGKDVLPISVADPQLSIQAAKDAEPERQRLAGVLTTAHAIMRGKRWTTPELVKVAMDAFYAPNVATDDIKALYEHLHDIAGQKDGKIDTRSLGKWISKQVDRWSSGLSLQHDGERSRLALWRIREKERA